MEMSSSSAGPWRGLRPKHSLALGSAPAWRRSSAMSLWWQPAARNRGRALNLPPMEKLAPCSRSREAIGPGPLIATR